MRFALAIILTLLLPALASAQPYWGEFADGGTLYFHTNTIATDGAPSTPAGETVAVYVDDSDTELTTGVTIDDDIDSRTGLHRVAIDTTQAGFDAGSTYTVVYTAGTSDSVSLTGRIIGSFRLTAGVNVATIEGSDATDYIEGRTLAAASYFDPASDTVANVTTVATLSGHTAQTGDSFARLGAPAGASVSADIAAIEDQTDDIGAAGAGLTAINLPNQTFDLTGDITGNLSGSVGSVTGAVGSVTSGVSLANGAITDASLAGSMEIVFETDFATNYNTTRNAWATNVQDTVGTGTLGLTIPTAANIVDEWETQSQNDPTGFHVNVLKVGGTVQTAGDITSLVSAIKVITDALGSTAASRLNLSAGTMVPGTVDTVTNGHTPTTTVFQADDITEATGDHYNGRIIIFTSGALKDQATVISDYVNVGGIGQFTVVSLTEAPTNNDTFIIL